MPRRVVANWEILMIENSTSSLRSLVIVSLATPFWAATSQ